MGIRDNFGRIWPKDYELCSKCLQPDNCGDCNHKPYTKEEAIELGAIEVEASQYGNT